MIHARDITHICVIPVKILFQYIKRINEMIVNGEKCSGDTIE